MLYSINPLIANPTKWPNTLKQFVGKLPTNCLSVFDHFVKFALKGLSMSDAPLTLDNKFQQYSYNLQCWPKSFGILQSFSRGLIDYE